METTPHTDAVRFRLHEGQTDVFRSTARFRVVVAGRRWGKTQLARTELVSRALAGEPGRYWYVAPTYKSAKDMLWKDLKRSVDESWLRTAPNETELSIQLCSGGEIRLMGAEDPDALRGRGLRFAVLDEYATMKPEAWTEAIRPALSDFKAPAMFIGTPRSFNHFHALFERGPNPKYPDWESWSFKTRTNAFLDPAEIQAARSDLDPRTFRQEYEASFEAMAGRAYYAFERAAHVAPVSLETREPVSLTFDFNIDPASVVIGQRLGDRAVVWREVQLTNRGGEATLAAARAAQQALRDVGHLGEIRIYGDATGKAAKTTGPADHQILRNTFPGSVWCIPNHNPHQRDRVACVNAMLRTADDRIRLTVDPRCPRTIADLEQVVYAANGELDKTSNPMLTHASDALGYWLIRDFPMIHRSSTGWHRVEWLL